jgi:methylenetetrahydrofolate dehydrogenase (NADP+) / methenyltetrahydrofolate cyclohydrolase
VTARLLDGRILAEGILASVAERVTRLKERRRSPRLAFVLIGDSPPARVYAGRLEKLGSRVGIEVTRQPLPPDVQRDDLFGTVAHLNRDVSIDGILVQMPLPLELQGSDLSSALSYRKDVDGITVLNAGHLYLGVAGHYPPTAVAMVELLRLSGVEITGSTAVVVGRSNVVGHPVAELLLHADATVMVAHRQTGDLGKFTSQADILMVGAGEPHLITADMVKEGAVVIDAGINVLDGRVVGDVEAEGVAEKASALTPVPGGVGPVTNAILLRHVIDSAEAAIG